MGGWAFAIEHLSIDGYLANVGRRLSAGTEAVTVSWTQTIDHFEYLADGEEVTSFQLDMAWYRYGTEPDRFLAEMRQAGLETEPPQPSPSDPGDDPLEEYQDDLVATLDMLTLALGIRLPAEVVCGPLLTGQRSPGTPQPSS